MFDSITPETIKEEAPPAGGQKECRFKAFDSSLCKWLFEGTTVVINVTEVRKAQKHRPWSLALIKRDVFVVIGVTKGR